MLKYVINNFLTYKIYFRLMFNNLYYDIMLYLIFFYKDIKIQVGTRK